MFTAEKIAERNKSFQHVPNSEDFAHIKEQHSVVLRKKKRLEHISKKRADIMTHARTEQEMDLVYSESLEFPVFVIPEDLQRKFPSICSKIFSSSQRLSHLVHLIKTFRPVDVGLISCLSRLLIRTKGFPFSTVFDSDLIDSLLTFLQSLDNELIYETLQVLISVFWVEIADLSQIFLNRGAAELISQLIHGFHSEIITESALWALANLMAEHKSVSEMIFTSGLWRKILKYCSANSYTMRGTAQWTLCNMSKFKCFDVEDSREIIRVSKTSLSSENENCLKEAAWTLHYLTENQEENIEFLFESGTVEVLIGLMKYHDREIQLPVIKVFGNISTSNNNEIFTTLAKNPFLANLSTLITHPERKIKLEVLFIFSNFLYSSVEVVSLIVQLPVFKIISDLLDSSDFYLKKEAICAVCNAACSKEWEIVKKIVELGLVPRIVNCLAHHNDEVVYWVLDALLSILMTFQSFRDIDELYEFFREVQNMSEFNRIESLVYHSKARICEKSEEILNFLN
jgi:hypothetical protein